MRRKLSLVAATLLAVLCAVGGSALSVSTVQAAPAAGPTAAQLLAKVTSCNQISKGKYKTDEDSGSATVPVCGKNGAVFWKADMDIDCDGQRTAQCNEHTDCCFQADTAYHQSDGKPLNAAKLPYVVVPSKSGVWDFSKNNIKGGTIIAVIYNNKVSYAVVGDTGPSGIIGEASYATAVSLGIDPNPKTGGVDSGVTYIALEGAVASPIENHDSAVSKGEAAAQAFISKN